MSINRSSETFGYLPIQEWFMKRKIKARHHFNHSFLICVNEPIDKSGLQRALEKLSRRHGMLRACYPSEGVCFLKESTDIEIKELDISGKCDAEIFRELTGWQNHFDPESGYLWQCGILRGYCDGSERIYMAFHHMIIDAASWSIIREDLKAFYEGRHTAHRSADYREWVEAVKAYSCTATDEERRWWEESVAQQEESQRLWQNLADERELHYSRIELSAPIVAALLDIKQGADSVNISDLLLAGLAYALLEVSGSRENWITLEKQGREGVTLPVDVNRTVGWFTTLFPVCLTVGSTIEETVHCNRERIGKIPGKGTGYGALYGYEQMPHTLFNYIEQLPGTDESCWQIRMSEASGESMSPDNRFGNIVDINGLGREGRIGLGVESCLKRESHLLLCDAFRRDLERVAGRILL